MRKKINIFQISGVHFARSGVSRLTNNKLAAQGDDDDDGGGCISMDQEKHFRCYDFRNFKAIFLSLAQIVIIIILEINEMELSHIHP
ncbi:hypothetical protein DERP_013307 [Dermatophagoides pteronyssinus]|uniref:Uncharacterized protein n=1 Tax=Dermatophagoides pteronyssinus TaxID=6956 RepID=A0ABQ8J3L1_DERPT|nr:hypothetical protein DERP_013307 [Dermatophagoides pteronyssinus]